MIYGLNFNGSEIPERLSRRFRQRMPGGFRLQGVATERHELSFMLVQADNGRRLLKTAERKTKDGTLFAVYVG